MSKDTWEDLETLLMRLEGAGEDLEHHLYRQERLKKYRERLQADSDRVFELFDPFTLYRSVIRTSLPSAALADHRMIFIF